MKAVVTLSKTFFPKHPRNGQETGFKDKVTDGRKVPPAGAITGIGGQKSKK